MYNSEEKKLADVYNNIILKGVKDENQKPVFDRQRQEKANQLEALKKSQDNPILGKFTQTTG